MHVRQFFQDRKASVLPMLALCTIPIMGAVAAGVDYGRGNSVRTSMQGALDATGLMLSKEAQTLNGTQLSQKASLYFNSIFKHPDAQNVQLTETLTNPEQGSFVLKINGTATVNTTFSKVMGQTEMQITATSEVKWGIKKLNLALVLDNTGSMANSGKMTQLKVAAHELLDTLKNAAKNPGDVKVSIVPFATDVNVGTSNVNSSWVRWTEWNGANGTCSNTSYHTQSTSQSNGKVWTPANHSTWNGCVMDRDQNNDVLSTAPAAGSSATLYPAHQAPACPVAMMPLSYDWPTLNSKVDAMTPTGNTNTTIGLQMGWQTLTAAAPFNAPAAATDLDKVIVLLTDGLNTQNRWTTSASSIDSRTQALCTNIKNANIKIYTVRVIDGNASLLQGCATKPDMYYDVQQASQLSSVFSSIAQNLANLRISK